MGENPSITALSQPFQWQQNVYSPWLRQWQIMRVMVRFLLMLGLDKLTGNQTPQKRHRRAKWLVRKLLILGPTFIKIGQSLSTRADLIPLEYVQELSQLQDNVPAFDSYEALAVIETELGKPTTVLFKEIDLEPLASASLGQVHRAILHTGERVVVKVQRPSLEPLFNLDFEVLHRLVRFGNRWLPGIKKYKLEGIYQEFFELLFNEIDYIHEGKNADRFRQNFQNYAHIKVPKIYWQYTTKKVLTLEYLPGIKVDDRQTLQEKGVNVDRVIQLGICSYLKQLLQDGFFQSDPHPGNMAVTLKGDLIFYDFGTMAELKTMARDQMIQTFFAVLRKDTNKIVETLVYMGLLEPVSDMTPVKRIVSFLLENFRDKPVDVKAFEQMSDEVYSMFQQQPFRLPPQMTFVLKSLTTLDGIARALDPQYNLLAASQPFVRSLATSGSKQGLVKTLTRQTRQFLKDQFQGRNTAEPLIREITEKIERGELEFYVRSRQQEKILKRIYLSLKSLIYMGLMAISLGAAIMLLSSSYGKIVLLSFSLSGLFGLFFVQNFIKLLLQERIDKFTDK
jgi:predicted unusual protein kinase regulating ubiquinone biosynthesis (AarF/ABC1/UbiB family)